MVVAVYKSMRRVLCLSGPSVVKRFSTVSSETASDVTNRLSNKKSLGRSYSEVDFGITDYHFENGFRKVYPYYYTYYTSCKGRWVGRSILDVYNSEFGAYQLEAYESRIRGGLIYVNNSQVDIDYVLKSNDFLTSKVHLHEKPVLDIPIKFLHSDDELLVLEKPCSMPVHPCGNYNHNSLLFILAKEYNIKGLYIINRLDCLTSGLLVFPKTRNKSQQIHSEMLNHKIQKTYICRVEGEFPDRTVVCDKAIKKLNCKVSTYIACDQGGKPSSTEFQKLSSNGRSSVVLCKPFTGRSHQIRVHLQYLGYPIVNDSLYNNYIFGPQKGRGGEFNKTLECLANDLVKRICISDYNEKLRRKTCHNENDAKNNILSYDENCYHCNVKAVDPDPKSLVMYLHALNYKGIGWEYETDMPLWASKDWHE